MSSPFRVSLMLPVEHAATDSIAERFDNLLEIARLAEDGGIDVLTAPQHYLAAPSQYLHCVPVLARVAAEVQRAWLSTYIIQLTLHHPVAVAESLATLDVICGERPSSSRTSASSWATRMRSPIGCWRTAKRWG